MAQADDDIRRKLNEELQKGVENAARLAGDSPAIKAIVESEKERQKELSGILDKFGPSFSQPQVSPIFDQGMQDSLEELGREARRKTKRDDAAAQATIESRHLMTEMVKAMTEQSQNIETLASATTGLTNETRNLSSLTLGLLVIAGVALAVALATLLATVVF